MKMSVPNIESIPTQLKITPEKLTNSLATATESLRDSAPWAHVREAWLNLSENDRLELYKRGSTAVWKLFLRSIPGLSTASDMRSFESWKLKFGGSQIAPAIRWLVHLSLLPAPAGITKEMILQDIAADQGSFNTIVEIACDIVMILAPECVPKMQEIKQIAKAIHEIKTTTARKVQDRLPEESNDTPLAA